MENQNVQKILIGVLSLAAFAALWELLAIYVNNSFFLPRFSSVFMAFINIVPTAVFLTDVTTSLYHFSIGFFFALLVGIPLGMMMGWFSVLDKALSPIVEIFRPIPPLAWIPFAIIWLKLTPQAAGFIIFMGMVFPIIINTYSGFKNVPKIYVEAAKVLGSVSNLRLIRTVAVPAASPMILSGIKTAMGVGWMCLAAAEMFGVSNSGIGYKIWFFYGLQAMD